MTIEIVRMTAAHAMAIDRQVSQRVQVGLVRDEVTEADAAAWAAQRESWAMIDGERVLACVGLFETFPGRQAIAWAILAEGIGRAHIRLTRHVRARIAASGLARIEALARIDVPAECAWARLVGLTPAAVLRKYGAQSEDHMLYERIA